MKEILRHWWRLFQKGAFFVGNVISTVFMVAFYFSLFALVALPARFFGNYLQQKLFHTNWVVRRQTTYFVQDFQHE